MKYKYIGWCKDEKTNTDKVWGVICLQEPTASTINHYGSATDGKYVTFWGRRGTKLQTKIWEGSSYDAMLMFEKKTNKGYKEVDKDQLYEVDPEFQSDLEKTAFWASFKI